MKKIEMLTLSLALGGMLFLTGCVSVQLRRAVEVEEIMEMPVMEEPVEVIEVEEIVEVPVVVEPVEVIEELAITHTVVRGETLWEIAGYEHIYGDPTQWRLIFEANRDILDHPDALRPGQVLIIPRK